MKELDYLPTCIFGSVCLSCFITLIIYRFISNRLWYINYNIKVTCIFIIIPSHVSLWI